METIELDVATIYKGEPGPRGPQGPAGPKGDPFTYESFTAEQLENLRGPSGPKGDPGTNDYVMPEDFGAVGDGVADDTAAFAAAIAKAREAGLGRVQLMPRRYFLKNLRIEDSVHIRGSEGTVITGEGGVPCMIFDYRSERRADVSAIAVEGIQTVLTVSEMPEDLRRGDILKLYANGPKDLVPNIRYNSHIGEFLSVFDFDREAKTITVYQKLRYNYVPEEGHVRLMYVAKKSVTLESLTVDISRDSETENNVGVFRVLAGQRHRFSDITIREAPESVFQMEGCYGYAMDHLTAMYQQNTDVFGDQKGDVRQLGYTITDNGGGYFRVTDSQCNNIRHFFDTGTANPWQEKRDTEGNILCHGGEISGVSEFGLVSGIVCHGSSTCALGTHENAYQVTFDNCVTKGGQGAGATIRGDRVIFRNSFIEAVSNGLYLMNFSDDNGPSSSCPGDHIFENLEVRVPNGEYVLNVVSGTPINAIFKNCTFYGSLAFNAPDSRYGFYNCQFYNSDGEGPESSVNIEAQGVVLDFYDCDINIRIAPRLGEQMNFVNTRITNTFNMFQGGWTDYKLSFRHCVLEGPVGGEMFMDFRGNNQCNVLIQDSVIRRVYFAVDLSGEKQYVEGAHKRFKLINNVIYPSTTRPAAFGIRCSCNIFAANNTVIAEADVERYDIAFLALYASEKDFPAEEKKVRVEIDGLVFTKDYMTFSHVYKAAVLKCEAVTGTVLGYIRQMRGTDELTDGISYLDEPENVTNNLLEIEDAAGSGGSDLPQVTGADEGKILRVVGGAWAAQAIARAEEGEF